jgi:hypothetical protein
VTWYEAASLAVSVVVSFVALGGLVARRKVSVCRFFVPYLGTVALADLLQLLWPDTFLQQWFWFGSQHVINVLRFALALELTYRVFRAFPSARATARGVLLVVLLITLAVVFAGTGDLQPTEGAPALGPLISRVQPRVLNGAIWLLTAIAGLILWYRLPVHPLHKAILIGYVPYLLIFTVSLNLIESQGWQVREQVNYLHMPAFLAVVTYWAVAAWRRAEAPVQAPNHERRLEQATG